MSRQSPMTPLRALIGVFGIALLTSTWASDQLEEVIVTAEKRSESLQTVPMSITAIGAEALQARAVVNFFDYGTKIPNLGFGYTGDGIGTSRTISIRGISGDNVTSIYLDETPLPDSIDPRILDIDHIEVLRGPQGTLYGARSMAGVVRIITKQPDTGSVTGFVHAAASDTWHTDEPNYNLDGSINIPLADDHAALRISGFFERDAGYLWRSYCTDPATAGVNCFPTTANPSLVTTLKNQGATDNYGGSLALTIKASDALTITPRFLYQKSTYNGFPLVDAPQGGGPAGFPAPATLGPLPPITPSDFVQARCFNTPETGSDQWSLATVTAKYETSVGRFVSSTSYFSRNVFERENMSEWVWQTFLAPGVPLPGTMSEQKKYDDLVQEVRFASELPGPWQFVAGAYFSDLHGSLPWAGQYPVSNMPGFAAAFPVPAALDPAAPDNIFAETYYTSIREAALFSESSYQFTAKLKGTVGLRFYQIDTTAGGNQHGAGAGGGPALVDADETLTARGVNPKGEVEYQINHEDMAYALVAKGFRPGGLVPSVPQSVCGTYIAEINPNLTSNDLRRYNSDSLWNYEVGAKTGWLDNTLTVNSSAFYIRWDNIQQWVPLPCGFQYRSNAGAAVSKGFELEVHARPAEGLDLTTGVGYNDARITATSAVSPQKVGDRVLQVPDWTANAALAYTVPLPNTRNLVGTLDYGYVGSSTSANNNPFEPRLRPSYEIVDARIALKFGQQELALTGKNLTNTHANLGDNRSIVAEVIGRPRIVTNQPQTFGVEFRSNF
jgi:iron complex outermembrane recepter protein